MKVLLYAHNGRSLGHISRMFTIASGIKRKNPEASVLCVSGCKQMHLFERNGVDYIKLPSYKCFDSTELIWPIYPVLNYNEKDFFSLRRKILKNLFLLYKPDIAIVDYYPLGDNNELDEAIKLKSKTRTKWILGLRGVIDSSDQVEETLLNRKNLAAIKKYYDHIYCYTDRNVTDIFKEYDLFDKEFKSKTLFTGYVCAEDRVNTDLARELRVNARKNGLKNLVVSFGGGQGSENLIIAAIESKKKIEEKFKCNFYVILGPYFESESRKRILKKYAREPRLHIIDSTSDILSYLKAADFAILAGGYNTLMDLLVTDTPSVVISRQLLEKEQEINANKFFHYLNITSIGMTDAKPNVLTDAIIALNRGHKIKKSINRRGVDFIANHVRSL